jgi:hypothetical protein
VGLLAERLRGMTRWGEVAQLERLLELVQELDGRQREQLIRYAQQLVDGAPPLAPGVSR